MDKFGVFIAVFSLFLQGAVLADLDPCEITKLTASDGAADDWFSNSVSLSGDYAIFGVGGDEGATGSAYIFRRNGTVWTEEAKLKASDGAAEDYFGNSVSLSSDYALIGARSDDDAGSYSGSAYIFRREGTAWIEEAKLTASDGAAYDSFGYSVSLSGDYALIGARNDNDAGDSSGSAYIFRREGTAWIEEAKLTASDGAADDWFGVSVSLSGDYALIGAYGDEDAGFDSGSAYIFQRNGTVWTEEAKLTASDGAAYDWFGNSVSLSGDYALIGAWWDDDADDYSGSAYIFRQEGTAWIEEAKLTASDGALYDMFGVSVSVSGDYALIGAYGDDVADINSGSAYIFQRNGTVWTEEAMLTASDGAVEDYFGYSVLLSGDYALIGAYGDEDAGFDSGSAYIFDLSGTACGSMILAGPGPSYDNPPLVRVFPPEQNAEYDYEIKAYGPVHYGVNITCGNVTGDGFDRIITGPGPGPLFGPHVRGFEVYGEPLQGLSFLAYGTKKWGVNVATGDIDKDGYDEIITGAGPGAVFGPHVRAFDYDGMPPVTPVHSVSFLAYQSRHWGVNVSSGDIDGDGYDEIITGPGPGAVFGPHVRAWNVDGGPATAIPAVSFIAYGTRKFGVRVAHGQLDGDVFDEIVTGPGPGKMFGTHVRGWNYDGMAVSPLPGCSFLAWQTYERRYGAKIFAGADLDRDGRDDLVVGCGPDPDAGTEVRVFHYNGAQVTGGFSFNAYPGMTQGTNVAGGWFLLP